MIHVMQHEESGLVLIQARDEPHAHLKLLRSIDAPDWAAEALRTQFQESPQDEDWHTYHPDMLTVPYIQTVPPPEPQTEPRTTQITIRLPTELVRELKAQARAEHRSLARQIAHLIRPNKTDT